ncbi:glycosyltransferase [Niameybacter massiliensis]|uniref:Glycosyltransferase n=1 Tax=Holtiella tumoricola TaxID=3018743 RepID=A0AA42DK18_9FIRM|nr:glycosyltransferase [Holtiella tumoricola]MDA3730329.1 glycosyltransferase [Holtiella tumoricola]
MNILILTGHFGMGHYSAAESIQQEITRMNPEAHVYIVDIIEYMFPKSSTAIYASFNFMVNKCASIYNCLNEIACRHSNITLKKSVVKKVHQLLAEYQADLVISTLPVSSQYISAYKEKVGTSIPLYTYITDITAHEEWITPHTDIYFVGATITKNILISKGVYEGKIRVSGIPVREDFHKEVLKRHTGINRRKEVLIMGGGLGLIPSYHKFLTKLCRNKSLHITVITGKNKALFLKMKKDFPSINVVGYTDKVAEYMRRADLVITKSGGSTTFEAIYCRTPLYIIKPFLMQEIGNAEYIEQKNIGRIVWSDKKDVYKDIMDLLNNNALLEQMEVNMANIKLEWDCLCPSHYFGKKEVA